MMRPIIWIAASILIAATCGCASAKNDKSIAFGGHVFGPICNVTSAPLSGDFAQCENVDDLKKGESSEVLFFQFYDPLVTAGDESIKSAMSNGNISEVYYADYSIRFFLVVGWFTVTVYGK